MAKKQAAQRPIIRTAAQLMQNKAVREKLLEELRRGFKWSVNGITDGVTNFKITPSFRTRDGKLFLTIKYAQRLRRVLGVALQPRGSVFSKSEAEVSKVEQLPPTEKYTFLPIVFVKGNVRHWTWEGKPAHV